MLRIEKKFIITPSRIHQLYKWIDYNSSFFPKYNQRFINSIYFDDIYKSNLYANLSGYSKRLKYRFRWYSSTKDTIKNPSSLNFEIKFRQNNLIGKYIHNISQQKIKKIFISKFRDFSFLKLINSESYSFLPIKDLLFPEIYCGYYRKYFETKEGIRLTIDDNIGFLDFSNGEWCNKNLYLIPNVVVECKFPSYLNEVASYKLKNFPFISSRNSKYLNGSMLFGNCNYY